MKKKLIYTLTGSILTAALLGNVSAVFAETAIEDLAVVNNQETEDEKTENNTSNTDELIDVSNETGESVDDDIEINKVDDNNIEEINSQNENIESQESTDVSKVQSDESIKAGDDLYISGDIDNVSVDNCVVTINAGGTYNLSGILENGQIIVDSADDKKVNIVLNGVNISCLDSAAIYVKSADKTTITLSKDTENYISDGESYVYEDETSDEPDAAIFSKDDLTINGEGSLIVNGNYKNGIVGKDDLKIKSGNITINAINNGIKGKDSIVVTGGNVTINSGGDGMKSTNDSNTEKGYISIENGTFNITSAEDAMQAENYVTIKDGDFTIVSGGGNEMNNDIHEDQFGPPNGDMGDFDPSQMGGMPGGFGGQDGSQGQGGFAGNAGQDGMNQGGQAAPGGNADSNMPQMPPNNESGSNGGTASDEESISSKGIKAKNSITIDGGTFNIDSCDDALHSDGSVTINNGEINIKAGDDGIHADYTLDINNGTVVISKSYEALEAGIITINDGNINITASDDGVNASGDTEENIFYVNGGYTVVNAGGDGLDANGSIYITDGTVIVNGPVENNNGALDYDGILKMDGGLLIAAGSVGMVQTVSDNSTQNCVSITLTSQKADTLVHIESEEKEDVLTFAPSKEFSNVVVCSPKLENGSSYKVYVGGTYDGEEKEGLYSEGSYTGGEEVGSFTISSINSSVIQEGASTGMGPGGGMMPPGGMPGGNMPGGMTPPGMPGSGAVDKSSLENLYNLHKDDTQGKYTTSTWNVFTAALSNAESVLENMYVSQSNVDNAYNVLNTAISSLKRYSSSSSSKSSSDSSASDISDNNSLSAIAGEVSKIADKVIEDLGGTISSIRTITAENGKNVQVITLTLNNKNVDIAEVKEGDRAALPIPSNKQVYVYSEELNTYVLVNSNDFKGNTAFMAEGGIAYVFAGRDSISNSIKAGWYNKDNQWCVVKTDGQLAKGWYKDNDGKWYNLNSEGKMNTGWIKDSDDKWYYLNSDGSMSYNTYINGYYLGADGSWIR